MHCMVLRLSVWLVERVWTLVGNQEPGVWTMILESVNVLILLNEIRCEYTELDMIVYCNLRRRVGVLHAYGALIRAPTCIASNWPPQMPCMDHGSTI